MKRIPLNQSQLPLFFQNYLIKTNYSLSFLFINQGSVFVKSSELQLNLENFRFILISQRDGIPLNFQPTVHYKRAD